MQKYFITESELINKKIVSDDVFHIKNVMRYVPGDLVIVSDGVSEYLVTLLEVEKKYVTFSLKEAIDNQNELPFFVDIYQGYPKGDKLDDICKHSTELGVRSLYAVFTKRSIVKLDKDRFDTKIERYNKIMKEASEQSNRKRKATFGGIYKLRDIDFSHYDYKILCFEESAKNNEETMFKSILKKVEKGQSICIFIGPEGGIDMTEVEYLNSIGFINVGLGPRILRTETASLYVLSAISYESELK